MAQINSNKETPSHSQRSLLLRYIKSLVERVYRPIKPLSDPLLKQIKLVFILIALLLIGLIGNYQNWVEQKKYERSLNQKLLIEKEISSWGKVLETKPEYRDVLLKLALLNWQLYQTDQAKIYWDKSNYLDPNNQKVQEVGKIIF